MFSELICFVVCHAGPAEHFTAFSQALTERAHRVQIYASGPAAERFSRSGTPFVRIDGESAEEVARRCEEAAVVVTDVGHPFAKEIHQHLKTHHFSYYDNPEPFVPGGYSEVAAQVMEVSEKVLFANTHLAETMELEVPKAGIGFYPTKQAYEVKELRAEPNRRARFFAEWNLEDRGQKVLILFGGNNEAYFNRALPAFLEVLNGSALEEIILVLQQHPGAKGANLDRALLEEQDFPFPVQISDFETAEIQEVADIALYHQTSMGPQFLLAGIPAIQVGERYEDILVRSELAPSVMTSRAFDDAVNAAQPVESEELLFERLGIKREWIVNLEAALEI